MVDSGIFAQCKNNAQPLNDYRNAVKSALCRNLYFTLLYFTGYGCGQAIRLSASCFMSLFLF